MSNELRMPELFEFNDEPVQKERFEVRDIGSADWAAGKIREAQQAIGRIKEHADRLRTQIAEWEQSESVQWQDQIDFFEPMIRHWAELSLAQYTKKRSLDLPSGMRIGFRAGSEVVEIEDEEKAIAELKQYKLTDSIKVKEVIVKAAVKKHLNAGIQFNTIRMDKKEDSFYVKESNS
nr:hypothetical protein 17 [Spirochaetaceae bacterium]